MEFLQLVAQRSSVRAYTAEMPDDATIVGLLESARLAPSACNRQPWHFYVVKSSSAKQRLCEAYHREWFRTAPLYVVVTIRHDEEWVRPADGHRHGIVDASIAAEHICLAATEAGLGTCWVCAFDPEICRTALPLAADEEPVIILPIGFPDPNARPNEKNRKGAEEIITVV